MKKLLLALLLTGCTPQPVFPPADADASPPSSPSLDALAPDPNPGDDACGHAYQHLIVAGCNPVPPASGTWVDVCRNDRKNGLFPLKCINTARSTTDAVRCGVTCQP